MTDTPEDDDAHASEALREARSQKSAAKNTNKWVAGAVVATGIGSAALAAALLYANRGRKKNDQ
jgi:hypothetical protein